MKNKKIELNIFMFIFLSLSLIVLLTDYSTYIFSFKYLYNLIIGTSIYLFSLYLLKNKINIRKDIKKVDIIFFTLIFFISLITIFFPDRTFDTLNYHLYLQENPFTDKIFSDFFPARNINSYTYAFTDRLFYPFRYFLGYRFGTVLQYGILIVIYYQCKNILSKFIKEDKNSNLIITLLAAFSTLTLSVIELVDSYYVDNISIIYLLEIFTLCMFDKRIEDKDDYNISKFVYIGILTGFSIVSKISNAFLIIVLFLLFIIKNRKLFKFIKINEILITISSFIFVIFIYVFYTWHSTGNPVFPFYNTIFKSDFYSLNNWMDTRFGPKTIIELLIWPIYIQFDPGRTYDAAFAEPIWMIGYLVTIIYLIYYFAKFIRKEKYNVEKKNFFFLILICYLVWGKFMLGYSRYGLVIVILGGLATSLCIYDTIKYKKRLMYPVLLLALSFNFKYMYDNYVTKAQFWTFNNYFANRVSYKYNIKKALKFNNGEKIKFEKNSIIALQSDNSGFASMISENVPLVTINRGISNEKTKKIFESYIKKDTIIYTMVDSIDLDSFIDKINLNEYYIKSVKGVYDFDFTDYNNYVYIFEIEKNKQKNNRTEIVENYDFKIGKSGEYNISFYAGLGKYMKYVNFDEFNIDLVKVSNGKEEILQTTKIKKGDGMLYKFDQNINLEKGDKLLLKYDERFNNYLALQLLNIEVHKK